MPTDTYDPTDPYHVNETLKEKDREITTLRAERDAAVRGLAQLREALHGLLCEATAMLYTSQTPWEPTYAERMTMDALATPPTDGHAPK